MLCTVHILCNVPNFAAAIFFSFDKNGKVWCELHVG